jgi:hypothetical protein
VNQGAGVADMEILGVAVSTQNSIAIDLHGVSSGRKNSEI